MFVKSRHESRKALKKSCIGVWVQRMYSSYVSEMVKRVRLRSKSVSLVILSADMVERTLVPECKVLTYRG